MITEKTNRLCWFHSMEMVNDYLVRVSGSITAITVIHHPDSDGYKYPEHFYVAITGYHHD